MQLNYFNSWMKYFQPQESVSCIKMGDFTHIICTCLTTNWARCTNLYISFCLDDMPMYLCKEFISDQSSGSNMASLVPLIFFKDVFGGNWTSAGIFCCSWT